MGTVTNLAEFRQKKHAGSDELFIGTQEGYAFYSSELRRYQDALGDLNYRYPPPKDPNDPKRSHTIDYSRRRYTGTIGRLDKALAEYADRTFRPALLKAVEDGGLLTPFPTSLTETLILRTRVTLMEEYRRQGYLLEVLKKEIDDAIPFREDLIAVHDKQLASQLKIKRVLLVNGWWEEGKV